MFEKTTTDLIKSLRQNKYSSASIERALSEIQQEIIKVETRVNAIQKLIVLHLLGLDIQWASFHIIQAMSLKSQKKTGYMAAAISFHRDTPVLIMATNLIKKDLNSNDISETIMALHTMAHILNHDLARDLYPEVLSLFNNSNFNVRQRALLVIYRICIKYPACFNTVFDRIVEKLADEDERVVSACVTVICELGRVNPEVYLPLVPKLFGLFCNSTNNWILIKMIKLFTSLTPLEPRLGKKLLAPLKNIIKNNNSMSVVYEAVYAIIAGDMLLQDEDDNVAILCVQKLQLFIKQSDPNLKFLGLLCFGKLIKTRPEIVKENRIGILKCLDNGDISIRINALDLTTALVSPDTLFELVQKLMSNLADTNAFVSLITTEEKQYRTLVGKTIIEICSTGMYINITNFEWYITVLIDLTKCQGLMIGELIKEQLLDICVRVREVREFAIETLQELLLNSKLIEDSDLTYILFASSWIIGEYATIGHEILMIRLLDPVVLGLPPQIQSSYLFAFLKLYTKGNRKYDTDFGPYLKLFLDSSYLEVQDRALIIYEIVKDSKIAQDEKNPWIEDIFGTLFIGDVEPVAIGAQDSVLVPDGLNLDDWIAPLDLNLYQSHITKKPMYEPKLDARDPNQFYLSSPEKTHSEDISTFDVPITRLSIDSPLKLGAMANPDNFISVNERPVAKKYSLKVTSIGETNKKSANSSPPNVLVRQSTEELETEPSEKKKRKKKKRKDPKKSVGVPVGSSKYTLWQSEKYLVECTVAEQPLDVQERLEYSLDTIVYLFRTGIGYVDFTIIPTDSNDYPIKDHELILKMKRENLESFFSGSVGLKLSTSEQVIEMNIEIPFEVNILQQTQLKLAQMTPIRFVELLQNPTMGSFTAVGTSTLVPPINLEPYQSCDMIAQTISAIVVERHPGVVSLYGSTVTNCDFFGLIKEKRNKSGRVCLVLDIKTGDEIILTWIMNALSNLASDWIG